MNPESEQIPAPPRAAVVIVARDLREPLERCLSALQGASQIIVVENGSSHTVELEERFPSVRFVRLPRDFGTTRALNIGIRAADADFILLLSPEVELTAAAVDRLAEALEADPQTGAVAPFLPGSRQVSDLPSPGQPEPPLRAAQPGTTVDCVTLDALMVRSFFLRALRNIDERYGDYGSAIELSQQAKRANKKILIHPDVTGRASPVPGEPVDREVGIARFLGKHYGLGAMLGYLLPRALGSFASLRFARMMRLVSLKKVDGA